MRTLRVSGAEVSYDLGVAADDYHDVVGGWSGGDGAAELILIDGELRRVPADEVDLLEISGVAVLA